MSELELPEVEIETQPETQLDRDERLCPAGHPVRNTSAGVDYVYFPTPYPLLRVRAEWDAIKTPAAYEGYTCLAPG